MDANLLQWAIGLVVVVLMGAWGRTANRITRNNEAVARLAAENAELRGRIDSIEKFHTELSTELRNVHQRIGGVAQTTNTIAGQIGGLDSRLAGLQSSVNIITEHLLGHGKE